MSLEQIRRALAAPCKTVSQRCVLMVLADFADDAGGSCYPSQPTLVSRSCLSPRHLRVVLLELRALHLVTVRPGIGRQSAAYTLTLEPVPDRLPPPDRPAVTSSLTGGHSRSDRLQSHFSPAATAANPTESPIEPTERGHARDPQGARPAHDPGNAPRFALPGVAAAPLNGHRPEHAKSDPVVASGKPPTDPAIVELRRKAAAAIADRIARASGKG